MGLLQIFGTNLCLYLSVCVYEGYPHNWKSDDRNFRHKSKWLFTMLLARKVDSQTNIISAHWSDEH